MSILKSIVGNIFLLSSRNEAFADSWYSIVNIGQSHKKATNRYMSIDANRHCNQEVVRGMLICSPETFKYGRNIFDREGTWISHMGDMCEVVTHIERTISPKYLKILDLDLKIILFKPLK